MRKNIFMISTLFILLFFASSCNTKEEINIEKENQRFSIVYNYGYSKIIVDNDTKVMYLFYKIGYGGGLTVMVDENGNPLIYNQ